VVQVPVQHLSTSCSASRTWWRVRPVRALWGQALFGEESVGGGHEGDVVVPARPGPALEVVQAQAVLEFVDPPAWPPRHGVRCPLDLPSGVLQPRVDRLGGLDHDPSGLGRRDPAGAARHALAAEAPFQRRHLNRPSRRAGCNVTGVSSVIASPLSTSPACSTRPTWRARCPSSAALPARRPVYVQRRASPCAASMRRTNCSHVVDAASRANASGATRSWAAVPRSIPVIAAATPAGSTSVLTVPSS
jgi:hypothetical protein